MKEHIALLKARRLSKLRLDLELEAEGTIIPVPGRLADLWQDVKALDEMLDSPEFEWAHKAEAAS